MSPPAPRPSTRRLLLGAAGLGGLALAATATAQDGAREAPAAPERLRAEVDAAERAFARTMAERDLAAFIAAIAPDAVFLNGGRPLHGRDAIGAHWARFFKEPAAPFSWQPEQVEVLATGQLAMTTGPVAAPDGTPIARFYSVWRREAAGRWRVVFDNGYSLPACPSK